MKHVFVKILMAMSIAAVCGVPAAAATAPGDVVAPLREPSLSDQVYVGGQRAVYDYFLQTETGVTRAVSEGLDAAIRYRTFGTHLGLTGTVRYTSGSLLGQKLETAATGVEYVAVIGRLVPFVQGQLGLSRLVSSDSIYLHAAPQTAFTTLVGAGIDLNVSRHWAIRPVYVENQYLPSLGSHGSMYWNAESGVVFQFQSLIHRKEK